MPEQLDIIAENEKLKLVEQVEDFILKATAKNLKLMADKLGGNIGIREHYIFQKTLLEIKKTIKLAEDTDKNDDETDVITVVRRGQE